jgi:hypothetical protein
MLADDTILEVRHEIGNVLIGHAMQVDEVTLTFRYADNGATVRFGLLSGEKDEACLKRLFGEKASIIRY